MRNDKIVNVKVTRHELCKLMLSCTNLAFDQSLDEGSRRMWRDLHDKLKATLTAWDETHDDNGLKIETK